MVGLEGFFSGFFYVGVFTLTKEKYLEKVLVFKKMNYVCFILKINLKKKINALDQKKTSRLSGEGEYNKKSEVYSIFNFYPIISKPEVYFLKYYQL